MTWIIKCTTASRLLPGTFEFTADEQHQANNLSKIELPSEIHFKDNTVAHM